MDPESNARLMSLVYCVMRYQCHRALSGWMAVLLKFAIKDCLGPGATFDIPCVLCYHR